MEASTMENNQRIGHKETGLGLPFKLLMMLLVLEYGRPHDFFPVIGALYPGWILYLSLLVCLLTTNKLFNFKNYQTKFFLGLLFLMTLHVPIATNNFHAYMMWRTTILHFITYMSIINFVNTFKKMEIFMVAWVILNLIVAFIGIINGGKLPHASFMGDDNDFALLMNMAIPFSHFIFLGTGNVLFPLTKYIFIIANIYSRSRGGFVGLILVLFYCWLRTEKKILAIITIIFMILVIFIAASGYYWKEIQTIGNENLETGGGTGALRVYFWKLAWKMFLDYPLIGIGQGNFPWVLSRYEPPGGRFDYYYGGRAAHSMYFTLISELGLVGTFIYAFVLFYSLGSLSSLFAKVSSNIKNNHELRKMRLFYIGTTGAMIGYLSSGIFLSVLYYPHFWFLIGLYVAIYNLLKKTVEASEIS